MTREEIELMGRLSKLLVEEKDPARFRSLVRELEDLLQKDKNSREQETDKLTAPKYPTAARVFL